MQTLIYILAVALLWGDSAHAQATNPITWASDQFHASLDSLKNSVEKLTAGNTALANRINDMRGRLTQMQVELQTLVDEHLQLGKSTAKLQEVNPGRARKISDLERDLFEVEGQLDQLTQKIQAEKSNLERDAQVEQQLTDRLQKLGYKPDAAGAGSEADTMAAAHEKEKLRLLRMVDESKAKQAELYEKMGKLHIPVDPNELPSPEILNRKIKEEELAIEQLSQKPEPPPLPPAEQAEQAQLNELDTQVARLQKSSDELEDLLERMDQKTEKVIMTPTQRSEQKKLKAQEDRLRQQAKELQKELSTLRRKMVELDKRKTALEAQVQALP